VRYDYLVLAAGSTTSYFGLDSLAQVTSALRDLDDAERLRDQVLGAFEAASAEEDPSRRRQLMTLIVVGGGPTGVELAGALASCGGMSCRTITRTWTSHGPASSSWRPQTAFCPACLPFFRPRPRPSLAS
jgi:NADH dehydrogenase FAD-containing subunit